MELLAGIALGIIITVIGFVYVLVRANARLEQDVSNLVDELRAEVAKTHIAARVEQHGDVFYVYDIANDHFLAQGSTLAELREILELRFRDKKIFVTEGEESAIDALRATGQ